MRLDRSSVRFVVFTVGMALALSVLTACGGSAAAPTVTAVAPAPSSAAAPAPSPARPALASPVASPSAVVAGVTPTATVAEAAGDTYEVASGDTLATIAQQFYGDPTQWRRIYDANKDTIGSDPDKLKLGMKLTIPPKQS